MLLFSFRKAAFPVDTTCSASPSGWASAPERLPEKIKGIWEHLLPGKTYLRCTSI
ncbi:MAG: hypothetical protein R3A10_06100 [Caldilineaceae bacterium]